MQKIRAFKLLSILQVIVFLFNLFFSSSLQAQTNFHSALSYDNQQNSTAIFYPTILKGIKVFSDNPFHFDFIIDTGDSGLKPQALKEESSQLIKYFLTSLTIPETDLWVNLSPYESNRIIPDGFGNTQMGRDLLALDLDLKNLTTTLIDPKGSLGKKFWSKVFQVAYQRYGTTKVSTDIFNKIWIVPKKAIVYEQKSSAYVAELSFKIMTQSDYSCIKRENGKASNISKDLFLQMILPVIEKEVNQGKSFSKLRQIFAAMVLATWYKQRFTKSLLSSIYVDRKKLQGIESKEENIKNIYNQYLKIIKEGAVNCFKEDYDYVTKKKVIRKYFSGGFKRLVSDNQDIIEIKKGENNISKQSQNSQLYNAGAMLSPCQSDSTKELTAREIIQSFVATKEAKEKFIAFNQKILLNYLSLKDIVQDPDLQAGIRDYGFDYVCPLVTSSAIIYRIKGELFAAKVIDDERYGKIDPVLTIPISKDRALQILNCNDFLEVWHKKFGHPVEDYPVSYSPGDYIRAFIDKTPIEEFSKTFIIQDILGQSWEGIVFKIEDINSKENFALKVFSNDVFCKLSQQKQEEMFLAWQDKFTRLLTKYPEIEPYLTKYYAFKSYGAKKSLLLMEYTQLNQNFDKYVSALNPAERLYKGIEVLGKIITIVKKMHEFDLPWADIGFNNTLINANGSVDKFKLIVFRLNTVDNIDAYKREDIFQLLHMFYWLITDVSWPDGIFEFRRRLISSNYDPKEGERIFSAKPLIEPQENASYQEYLKNFNTLARYYKVLHNIALDALGGTWDKYKTALSDIVTIASSNKLAKLDGELNKQQELFKKQIANNPIIAQQEKETLVNQWFDNLTPQEIETVFFGKNMNPFTHNLNNKGRSYGIAGILDMQRISEATGKSIIGHQKRGDFFGFVGYLLTESKNNLYNQKILEIIARLHGNNEEFSNQYLKRNLEFFELLELIRYRLAEKKIKTIIEDSRQDFLKFNELIILENLSLREVIHNDFLKSKIGVYGFERVSNLGFTSVVMYRIEGELFAVRIIEKSKIGQDQVKPIITIEATSYNRVLEVLTCDDFLKLWSKEYNCSPEIYNRVSSPQRYLKAIVDNQPINEYGRELYVEDILGQGFEGIIFKVKDPKDNKKFALKDSWKQLQGMVDFWQEKREVIAKIKPELSKYFIDFYSSHSYGKEGTSLLMEYVRWSETLDRYIGVLPPKLRIKAGIKILGEVAKFLKQLHSLNIAFGDMTLTNILVLPHKTKKFELKLIDQHFEAYKNFELFKREDLFQLVHDLYWLVTDVVWPNGTYQFRERVKEGNFDPDEGKRIFTAGPLLDDQEFKELHQLALYALSGTWDKYEEVVDKIIQLAEKIPDEVVSSQPTNRFDRVYLTPKVCPAFESNKQVIDQWINNLNAENIEAIIFGGKINQDNTEYLLKPFRHILDNIGKANGIAGLLAMQRQVYKEGKDITGHQIRRDFFYFTKDMIIRVNPGNQYNKAIINILDQIEGDLEQFPKQYQQQNKQLNDFLYLLMKELFKKLKTLRQPEFFDPNYPFTIDMHMHSICSDGKQNLAQMVYTAYLKGLKTVALTDHQSFDGVIEAMELGEILGVRVIPAVELYTGIDNDGISYDARDILVYFFDVEKFKIWYEGGLDDETRALFVKGAHRKKYVDIKEVVAWAQKHDGMSIFAHPGRWNKESYQDNWDYQAFKKFILDTGLRGIEISHPEVPVRDTIQYIEFVRLYNEEARKNQHSPIIFTLGTDSHDHVLVGRRNLVKEVEGYFKSLVLNNAREIASKVISDLEAFTKQREISGQELRQKGGIDLAVSRIDLQIKKPDRNYMLLDIPRQYQDIKGIFIENLELELIKP